MSQEEEPSFYIDSEPHQYWWWAPSVEGSSEKPAKCDFWSINANIYGNKIKVPEINTLTDDSTTAQLACCNLGVTLSTIFSASRASAALYLERASSIKTWPHLIH